MKIDFHTHGKLMKRVPFSSQYLDCIFTDAKKSGLDAICLTEHFNTNGFDEVYEYIKREYKQEGDCFLSPSGLYIFPGMEVDIAEGGHTLVISEMDTILEMNKRLEKYKEKGAFIPFDSLKKMVKEEHSLIFGAAHPFREGGHIPDLQSEQLDAFDFLDLNGKDMAKMGEKNKELLLNMSHNMKKPLVAGSDTHQSFQYGCIYNEFNHSYTSVQELKSAIAADTYKITTSKDLRLKVEAAAYIKRSFKRIYEMGGDYISLLLDK